MTASRSVVGLIRHYTTHVYPTLYNTLCLICRKTHARARPNKSKDQINQNEWLHLDRVAELWGCLVPVWFVNWRKIYRHQVVCISLEQKLVMFMSPNYRLWQAFWIDRSLPKHGSFHAAQTTSSKQKCTHITKHMRTFTWIKKQCLAFWLRIPGMAYSQVSYFLKSKPTWTGSKIQENGSSAATRSCYIVVVLLRFNMLLSVLR